MCLEALPVNQKREEDFRQRRDKRSRIGKRFYGFVSERA
jgi:hypothetical protein